jgi:hypothetical protein
VYYILNLLEILVLLHHNLVVFESDLDNAVKLKENCDLNNLNFIIEDNAISKRLDNKI